MALTLRVWGIRAAHSNATDFSNALAWGQLATLTGKMATGSLLAAVGAAEAFCGSLGWPAVLNP